MDFNQHEDLFFCTEVLEEALDRYGTPEIFNTDQGSQFTSLEFTNILKVRNIQITMDGKGQGLLARQGFVERLWKTIKYEEIYLHASDSTAQGRPRCRDRQTHRALQ